MFGMNTPASDVWVRNLIESLGGTYVGIQQSLDPADENHVMFTRVGSTTLLSLPLSKFNHSNVVEKLGKNVTSSQKVELGKVKDDFMRIVGRLRSLADEIEEEIENV